MKIIRVVPLDLRHSKNVRSHLQLLAAGLRENNARYPLDVRLSGNHGLLDAVGKVRNMRGTECSGLPFHNLFTIFIKISCSNLHAYGAAKADMSLMFCKKLE